MNKLKGYMDPTYLKASGAAALPTKQKSYALMQINERHQVLDVGCGPSTMTI